MACPACGCRTTYQFDDHAEDLACAADCGTERCAACGHVFHVDEHTDEDDDDFSAPPPSPTAARAA